MILLSDLLFGCSPKATSYFQIFVVRPGISKNFPFQISLGKKNEVIEYKKDSLFRFSISNERKVFSLIEEYLSKYSISSDSSSSKSSFYGSLVSMKYKRKGEEISIFCLDGKYSQFSIEILKLAHRHSKLVDKHSFVFDINKFPVIPKPDTSIRWVEPNAEN
jgi:hypothetical protein